ncbi:MULTISPECIES: hypothetical protein [Cyanophyceae]|uniref:hypothetical protein n=1 Tax=Cyanophyceae TaxID=3028117 RepID=UPI001685DA5B|nr:hypothetical protein [Trichocoleus sp. FACHB-40]MBD2006995.1 hypothetical protein [Trichocoleus sp. FACHB-40]
MFNQIKTITLGIGYGLYLTLLAPTEQRKAALARVRSTPQPQPEAQPEPEETMPDPWTLPASEAPTPVQQQSKVIAPLLLLPAAQEQVEPASTEQPKSEINLSALDSSTLRKLCTQYGIAWKNIRGQGKHMKKDAMVFQLERVAAAA